MKIPRRDYIVQTRMRSREKHEFSAICKYLELTESEAIREAIKEWTDAQYRKAAAATALPKTKPDRIPLPTQDLALLNAPTKGKIKD